MELYWRYSRAHLTRFHWLQRLIWRWVSVWNIGLQVRKHLEYFKPHTLRTGRSFFDFGRTHNSAHSLVDNASLSLFFRSVILVSFNYGSVHKTFRTLYHWEDVVISIISQGPTICCIYSASYWGFGATRSVPIFAWNRLPFLLLIVSRSTEISAFYKCPKKSQ